MTTYRHICAHDAFNYVTDTFNYGYDTYREFDNSYDIIGDIGRYSDDQLGIQYEFATQMRLPDVSTGVSELKAGKVFADEPISWTATRPKGTQQTYEVFQRNDINWNLERTAGDKRFIGKTNVEAANAGLAPQLNDGNFATLHHLGQDSRGALAEASTRYHGVGKYGQDILHSQYGKNVPNPQFPIDRQKFGIDTREYWQGRVTNR